MATTWIKPRHTSKGKTTAQTIKNAIEYGTNPEKTDDGKLVSGHLCNPHTAPNEFMLSQLEYEHTTGRKRNDDILLYHVRQSFKPNEITPELANQIGQELALKFTKGKHAFVVATHIDQAHIHNHIYINSINTNGNKKFRNPIRSHKIISRISDHLCLQNGLSIVESPKLASENSLPYSEWAKEKKIKKAPTARQKLETLIDKVLEQKPATYEEFVKLIEAENCEFKESRNSVRLPKQKGFIRLNSLSDDYKEDAIRKRILEEDEYIRVARDKEQKNTYSQKFNLLIDIQDSIKAINNPNYAQWAKVFNLKQAAKTLIFLQDNELTELDALNKQAQLAKNSFNDVQGQIKSIDSRLNEISNLQKHIGAYLKTKDIYAEYKRQKFSKNFYRQNSENIEKHKQAKIYFDSQKLQKLPTIKMLQQEYAALTADKKKCYSVFNQSRNFMQEVLKAQQNVEQLLKFKSEIGENTHEVQPKKTSERS